MSDEFTHELVVCLDGGAFIVIAGTEDDCAVKARKVHDDWAKGNKGICVSEGERLKHAINLSGFQGLYTRRRIESVHERQVKAMEKIAKAAASDGEQWKGEDDS